MNWKLVFTLSLIGLVMALASVFILPPNIEPFFWLLVFLFSAYCIARYNDELYFLHGVFVGLFNSLWVTVVYLLFYGHYYANHHSTVNSMYSLGITGSVFTTLLLLGPATGLVCGSIIGFFAFLASKFVKPREI